MKKKSLSRLLPLVFLLALVGGCGSDKNLNPEADLFLKGADPPTFNVDVNPPQTRQTYFLFQVRLSDPSLSMVGKDTWVVDKVDVHYVLLSDPGRHLLGLPDDVEGKSLKSTVSPGVQARVAVPVVDDGYVQNNGAGFSGTSDQAVVRANFTFHTHRRYDGVRKVLTHRFQFAIGDF